MKKVLFAAAAFCISSMTVFWVGEIAARLRQAAHYSFLVPDRALGYKLNSDVDGVNSLGIRHGELTRHVPGSPLRVLVIGDSVAAARDGLVAILRDRVTSESSPPVEVINAAIPGYTTYQQRVLLERDLEPYGADLVLLQYCLNDNYKYLHELDERGRWVIIRDRPGSDSWIKRSALLGAIKRRLRALSRDRDEGTVFPWATNEFRTAWRDDTWPDQESHLRAIQGSAQRMGARFALVVVPYEPQLSDQALASDRAYTLFPQRKLAAVAQRLDFPLLDLHESFLRARERALYTDKIHLTESGHALAAEEIFAFVEREALLPIARSE